MYKFNTGKLMQTRAVAETCKENLQFEEEVTTVVKRYLNRDWGDLDPEDKEMNDRAVITGDDRILAAYHTCEGKIYIITEWDRSYTTILFADEY